MHRFKSWGLMALIFALVAVVESKSAFGAYHTVVDHVSGLQHGALSIVCAVLAVVFSSMAGGMRDDERPYVRRRASLARIVSICFLIVPIGYLGSALKDDRIETTWTAYTTSAAYPIDAALAADRTADPYEARIARERMTRPSSQLTMLDGEFYVAAFLQFVLITAAGIPLAPPITDAEVKHWRAVRAGHKAFATRERNRKAREAKKRAAENKPAFGLVLGGKK